MYEYVPKTEYATVRKELEEIIRKAQVFLRQKYGITFQFRLIGSGNRHLIMRDTSGNKGYDFDYNLILPYKPEQKPKQLNEYFRLAFNFAVKGTAYKCPEDSTTVLTIKVVDPKHKKIAHSCDFLTYQVVTYFRFCTNFFVEKEKSSPSESWKGLLVIVYLFFSPFSPHSAKISAKSKNAKSPCKQYIFGFSALSTDEFAQTKKFHQVP